MRTLLPSVLFYLLFFLSVSGNAYSRVIELEGNVKFVSSGDNNNVSYKRDVSKWNNVIIPQNLAGQSFIKGKTFFYRINLNYALKIIKSLSIAVMFTGIGGSPTLYLNGNLIKEHIKPAHNTDVFIIPASFIYEGKDNILVLKLIRASRHSKLGIYSSAYLGDVYEILKKTESQNMLYVSLAVFILVCSILCFFTLRSSTKTYYPLYLAFALLLSAFYLFMFSSFSQGLVKSMSFKIRIFALSEALIICFYVMFLRSFYNEGAKIIEIPYFILSGACILYAVFAKDVYTIKYAEIFIFGIAIAPFSYYVPVIWKDIFKKRFSSLFFLLGGSLGFIFSALMFFLNFNNPYLNIIPATVLALSFSFAILVHYVFTYHELLESKYILESKALMNNLIVDEKNVVYFEVDNKLQALEEMLLNTRKMCASVQNSLTDNNYGTAAGLKYDIKTRSLKYASGDKLVIESIGTNALRFIIIDYPGDEITSAMCNLIYEKEIGKTSKIKSPSKVLDKLNKAFSGYGISTLFSLIVADIFPDEKLIKYSGAGFPDILVIRDGNALELSTDGGPIGLDDERYQESEFVLTAGDEVIIYTDGIMHQARKEKNMPFKSYISGTDALGIYNSLVEFAAQEDEKILDDILILKVDIL